MRLSRFARNDKEGDEIATPSARNDEGEKQGVYKQPLLVIDSTRSQL